LQVGGDVLTIAGAICLAILLLLRHFSEFMRSRLLIALGFLRTHHFEKAERTVNAFIEGVESAKSYKSSFWLVIYTLVEWLLIFGCYLCVVRSFGRSVPLTPIDIVILMGFVSFGSIVQIPGVGGGIQVVTVVVLRELFGIGLETSTSVAVMIWIITFIVI